MSSLPLPSLLSLGERALGLRPLAPHHMIRSVILSTLLTTLLSL